MPRTSRRRSLRQGFDATGATPAMETTAEGAAALETATGAVLNSELRLVKAGPTEPAGGVSTKLRFVGRQTPLVIKDVVSKAPAESTNVNVDV